MKQLLLISLFLSSAIIAIAQTNVKDAKGRKQGLWISYYTNSRVPEYQGEFKDNIPQGTFTYYYKNNKPKAILKHENNASRTTAYMYYEDGKLMAVGTYKNQQKDSVWTTFNEDGRLVMKESFKNGKLDGPKRLYYLPSDPSDKREICISIYNYKDGEVEGDFVEYYPTGQLKKKGSYLNHRRHGEVITYELDGKKMAVEHYHKGQAHGWFIGYERDGSEGQRRYFYYGRELKGKELEINMQSQKKNGQNPNIGYH